MRYRSGSCSSDRGRPRRGSLSHDSSRSNSPHGPQKSDSYGRSRRRSIDRSSSVERGYRRAENRRHYDRSASPHNRRRERSDSDSVESYGGRRQYSRSPESRPRRSRRYASSSESPSGSRRRLSRHGRDYGREPRRWTRPYRAGREEKEAAMRKLDHAKELPPTTMVALKEVPLDVTENAIESSVRSLAISIGFSPPNFVRKLPRTKDSDVVTTAYVDFPSSDAAQQFYDTSRRTLTLNGKRVYLELKRLPPGTLGLLNSSTTPEEWSRILACVDGGAAPIPDNGIRASVPGGREASTALRETSRATDPHNLGPGISCPNMDEFVMDRKSGLLFHEKSGLYFDTQNQQYISTSGVYYVRQSANPKMLAPIHRIPNPLGLSGSTSSFSSLKVAAVAAAAAVRDDVVADKDSEEMNSTTAVPQDPEATKATAVASILAAAQLAAKATKKVVKPKAASRDPTGSAGSTDKTDISTGVLRQQNQRVTNEAGGSGEKGLSNTDISAMGSERSASSCFGDTVTPSIKSVFADTTLEDDPKENDQGTSDVSENGVKNGQDSADSSSLRMGDTQGSRRGTSAHGGLTTTGTPGSVGGPSDGQSHNSTADATSQADAPSHDAFEQYICYVCIQQFCSAAHLSRHEMESKFHKVRYE